MINRDSDTEEAMKNVMWTGSFSTTSVKISNTITKVDVNMHGDWGKALNGLINYLHVNNIITLDNANLLYDLYNSKDPSSILIANVQLSNICETLKI